MERNEGLPLLQKPCSTRKSIISDAKVPMHAEYLMDYYLKPTGELEKNKDSDESLQKFITSCRYLSDEYKEAVLLQIDHCLFQLHRKHLAWPQLSPSKVMIMKSEESTPTAGTDKYAKEDIRSLANIYCFVLTDGKILKYSRELSESNLICFDKAIAFDLIKNMAENEEYNIKDVLKHPFHWSNGEKIRFICQAYDFMNPEGRKSTSDKIKEIVEDYGIDNGEGVIPRNGWFNKLKLTEDELKSIKKQVEETKHRSSQRKVRIGEDIIYDKRFNKSPVDENGKPKPNPSFDEFSIFDLIRFFRNRHAHYWEDGKLVRYAFGSYLSGYWDFYSSRYPKLFMHVYHKMKCDMRDNQVFLDSMAGFTYLPTLTLDYKTATKK